MASTTFSQSKKPYTNYRVSNTKPELLAQPEEGSDDYDKIVRSMFLPVYSEQNTNVTFLILKPQNLWLSLEGATLVDIHKKSSTDIVNYSPEYKDGDLITINFLPYPLTFNKLFYQYDDQINQILIGKTATLFGPKITAVIAEDANSANRSRIAAPNLSPSNYDSFSRWL